MGKKVSPHSLRIGITRTWNSRWYAKRGYADQFLEDLEIRKFLQTKYKNAGVGKVEIVRTASKIIAEIYAAKPGMIVGRGGEEIQALQKTLREKFGDSFEVKVQEIRKPEANAQLIADNISDQITRRFPYRRVVKMAVDKAAEAGAKGVKVIVAGRLNGVDIARTETYNKGTVPLHTLRADIDYATSEALTMYGIIGVKVWIYNGLVFKNEKLNNAA